MNDDAVWLVGFHAVLGALDHPLRPFRGVRLTVAGDGLEIAQLFQGEIHHR